MSNSVDSAAREANTVYMNTRSQRWLLSEVWDSRFKALRTASSDLTGHLLYMIHAIVQCTSRYEPIYLTFHVLISTCNCIPVAQLCGVRIKPTNNLGKGLASTSYLTCADVVSSRYTDLLSSGETVVSCRI